MPQRALSLSLFVAVAFVLLTPHAFTQTAPVRIQQPVPVHPGPAARGAQPHQEPCYQVAGISKSAMNERRMVQQRARSEIQALCADSSLTPQQRQQKMKLIHEQTRQELDALVSPGQMEELKSCQMSRNHGAHGGGHPGIGGGHGPCGELPAKGGPKPPPGGKPEDVEPED